MDDGRRASTGLALHRLKQSIGEASSLAPVTSRPLLAALGADAACWLVHDEQLLRSSVSILTFGRGRFAVVPVRLNHEPKARTSDGESLFVHEGVVHVVGSAFVGRKGTIDPRRAFVATFTEADVRVDKRGKKAKAIAGATLRVFGLDLTAAAMHALEQSRCEIATPSRMASRAAKKAGLPGGVPINIEGAVAAPDGRTFLGLRTPVSSQGDPIILELDGGLAKGLRSVAAATVHIVELGATPAAPIGVRDMAWRNDRLHLIVSHADAEMSADRSKRAHPRHISVNPDGSQPVVHMEFGRKSRVEGLAYPASAEQGQADGWWYVVDDEKSVVVLGP